MRDSQDEQSQRTDEAEAVGDVTDDELEDVAGGAVGLDGLSHGGMDWGEV